MSTGKRVRVHIALHPTAAAVRRTDVRGRVLHLPCEARLWRCAAPPSTGAASRLSGRIPWRYQRNHARACRSIQSRQAPAVASVALIVPASKGLRSAATAVPTAASASADRTKRRAFAAGGKSSAGRSLRVHLAQPHAEDVLADKHIRFRLAAPSSTVEPPNVRSVRGFPSHRIFTSTAALTMS